LSKLPSKLGDLIRLALSDLEACESTPGYLIEMDTWHKYSQNEDTCYVCLAGAVMANTLGVPRDVTETPKVDVEDALGSLDLVRAYIVNPNDYTWRHLVTVFEQFCSGLDINSPPPTIVPTTYSKNPDQFKVSLAEMADHFDELDVEFIG